MTADQARRFSEAVMPHAGAAYNLALRLSRRPEAAEDLVHDAFLRAMGGFEQFRGDDARCWLLRIVRNRAYDWLREQKLKAMPSLTLVRDDEDEDAVFDPPDLDQDTPEAALARRGEAIALHQMIDRLAPSLREVLVLREMEELSYREIAQVTAAPIGSVMSRLARARAALAQAWTEREAMMRRAGA